MPQRFTSRYSGKRYSFGYPACPDLEDQAGLWKLLRPEEIGVQLTEGFMMDTVSRPSNWALAPEESSLSGRRNVAPSLPGRHLRLSSCSSGLRLSHLRLFACVASCTRSARLS
jgi:Vitamin B12 dependent methionine synthase, activation domain